MRWLDGITDSVDTNMSRLGGTEGQRSLARCSLWDRRVARDLGTQQQNRRNKNFNCSILNCIKGKASPDPM